MSRDALRWMLDPPVREHVFDGQRCPDCDRYTWPVDGYRRACRECGQVVVNDETVAEAVAARMRGDGI